MTFKEAKSTDRLEAARTLPLAEIPSHWLQDPEIDAVVFERTLGAERKPAPKVHPPTTTNAAVYQTQVRAAQPRPSTTGKGK